MIACAPWLAIWSFGKEKIIIGWQGEGRKEENCSSIRKGFVIRLHYSTVSVSIIG